MINNYPFIFYISDKFQPDALTNDIKVCYPEHSPYYLTNIQFLLQAYSD